MNSMPSTGVCHSSAWTWDESRVEPLLGRPRRIRASFRGPDDLLEADLLAVEGQGNERELGVLLGGRTNDGQGTILSKG